MLTACSSSQNTRGQVGVALPKQQAVPRVLLLRYRWQKTERCRMPPFREHFPSTVWVVLIDSNTANSENCFGGGRANYLAVGFPSRCMFLLTRRFASRRSAQTKVAKRPPPSFLNIEVYWTSLCEPRIPSHGFHPSFPTHHPLTVLLIKPIPQAQTRVQAAGAGTAEKTSPHKRLISASSSNPLAALPTGGIMGPPAAQWFRTRNSPFVAGEGGAGQE